MNGRFFYSALNFLGGPEPREHRRLASPELVLSLAASCLLHATAAVLPYLGSISRDSRIELEQPHAFTATLAATTPLAATISPREGDPYPAASLPKRVPGEKFSTPQLSREGTDLLPIPAPIYYSTDQLTKRPQALADAKLETPEISPIIASGKIILKLWISDRGEVIDVEVENTELPEAFSFATIAGFKQLRFIAGERFGQPVGSIIRIEVSYVDGRLPPP